MTDNIRDAVGAALADESIAQQLSAVLNGEGTDSEATPRSSATPSSLGAQPDVEPETGSTESETTGTDSDAPAEYFGVDLSELPAEKRREIIAGFRERDDYISKLLREKAEPSTEAPAAPPVEAEELTDDALLQALGLDPENDMFDQHTAKVALPLARQLLETKAAVDQLMQTQSISQAERFWNSSLDSLEKQFGELPIDRVAVLEFAAENQIADPQDAYWRIMGPVRQQLMNAVQTHKQSEMRDAKKGAASVRPRTTGNTTPARLEATSVRNAVYEAAKIAAEERGLDWEQAVKGF